ncbi:MAG: hypothetical protein CMJ86_05885 [Planctomycetes bacterium]|jgi:hypothetical protein|nr:hypothetical protein [Planctomycetota bacterium]
MHWHISLDEALERAKERSTPVLLYLRTAWSPGCRALETGSLRDLQVLGLLDRHYTCIKADKDEQPDLERSYGGLGWPTLLWLNHEGKPLAHSSYLPPRQLSQRLMLGADTGSSPAGALEECFAGLETSNSAEDGVPLSLADEVLEHLLASSDPVHGGWGKRQKFPHPEALHFATVRWSRTGDDRLRKLVLCTLEAMEQGAIHDASKGGFFRYAGKPDWSEPSEEKPLGANAGRLLTYLEAHQAFAASSFAETALGILNWLEETLRDEKTGLWYACQDRSSGSPVEGGAGGNPALYTDRNALAVEALLKAAVVLDQDNWQERALDNLTFLVRNLITVREGVHHEWKGLPQLPGMLSDRAALLRAMVQAMHSAGDNRFLVPAVTLARGTLASMSAHDGSLLDRRHQPAARGSLTERPENIHWNALFAEACIRLGHMARAKELVHDGRRILAAFQDDWRRFGHWSAAWGRAVDLMNAHPLHITVVGPSGADDTRSLQLAALRPYVANRVVQTLDPAKDQTLIEHAALPQWSGPARAFVHQGLLALGEARNPVELERLLS